jgi:hypothetical protein
MKKIVLFLSLIAISIVSYSQTLGFVQYDSIYLQRKNGNAELVILNASRGKTGSYLKNSGLGRTVFSYAIDTAYWNTTNDTLILQRGDGLFKFGIPKTDTTSLSNRIDLRLKIADTAGKWIQNQNTSIQTSSNFNIDGTGIAGKIGVGTSSFIGTEKLRVNGDQYIDGNLNLASTSQLFWNANTNISQSSGDLNIKTLNRIASTANDFRWNNGVNFAMMLNSSGSLLINATLLAGSAAEKFKVSGNARIDNNLIIGSASNYTGGYALQVNGGAFIATGGAMTDGLIAFGTQTATINQIASFRNSISNGSRSLWLTANDFTFNTYSGSAYSTFGVINNSGQWGIGTNAFVGTEKLRVKGNAIIDSTLTVSSGHIIGNASTTTLDLTSAGGSSLGFNGTNLVVSSGRVQSSGIFNATASSFLLSGALGIANLATDPLTPSNGWIYYNTTSNKFRKYVNGAWVDLVSTSDAILNQTGSHQTGSFDITGTATIMGGATIGTTSSSSNTTINSSSNGIFTITQTNGLVIVNNTIESALSRTQQSWERGTGTQGRFAVTAHTANTFHASTLGTVTGYSIGTATYSTTGQVSTWTGASFGASFVFDNQTSANNPNAISVHYANGLVPLQFKKDGTTVITKLTQVQPSAITAAATTTIDLATGNIFQVNIGADITTLTLNNATVGQYIIKFTQDATGGRSITWPANFKWSGGTAPTLSAANKTDIITATYDGTNFYATAQLNF